MFSDCRIALFPPLRVPSLQPAPLPHRLLHAQLQGLVGLAAPKSALEPIRGEEEQLPPQLLRS